MAFQCSLHREAAEVDDLTTASKLDSFEVPAAKQELKSSDSVCRLLFQCAAALGEVLNKSSTSAEVSLGGLAAAEGRPGYIKASGIVKTTVLVKKLSLKIEKHACLEKMQFANVLHPDLPYTKQRQKQPLKLL